MKSGLSVEPLARSDLNVLPGMAATQLSTPLEVTTALKFGTGASLPDLTAAMEF